MVNFEHFSHLCSSVSIVNFEQVNVDWDPSWILCCKTVLCFYSRNPDCRRLASASKVFLYMICHFCPFSLWNMKTMVAASFSFPGRFINKRIIQAAKSNQYWDSLNGRSCEITIFCLSVCLRLFGMIVNNCKIA